MPDLDVEAAIAALKPWAESPLEDVLKAAHGDSFHDLVESLHVSTKAFILVAEELVEARKKLAEAGLA